MRTTRNAGISNLESEQPTLLLFCATQTKLRGKRDGGKDSTSGNYLDRLTNNQLRYWITDFPGTMTRAAIVGCMEL